MVARESEYKYATFFIQKNIPRLSEVRATVHAPPFPSHTLNRGCGRVSSGVWGHIDLGLNPGSTVGSWVIVFNFSFPLLIKWEFVPTLLG